MSSVLDDYEPLEVIGNGSFGVIRKVKRRSDGELFARKELNFERMTDRDRKQIVAEVNILKDLKHDNIVRYINRYVDQENKMLYILMEYCGGGDLASLINTARRQSRPLPEDQIWNLFVQILLALHHCHFPNQPPLADASASSLPLPPGPEPSQSKHQQVLHRDLKPENVFLSSDNCIKLGDFGLAKQIASASFASTYVGTPYYMSPELMNEKAYDTKSDIWSLGCLVYELCALNAPFHDAQTYTELANSIRSGRIPPIPKGYSTALNSVIKSMLNINPAMRPSTAQLLKVEQLAFAYKLVEVNKMITDVRNRREALHAREKAATAREQAILEREAAGDAVRTELLGRVKQLEEEAALFVNEKNQLAAERIRFNSERELLERAASDFAKERVNFEEQVSMARDAYRDFTEEKLAFQKAKAQWEAEVLARMSKAPLDDVKNKVSLYSSRYNPIDDTPTKVVNEQPLHSLENDETPSKIPINKKLIATVPSVPPLPALAPRVAQRLRSQHKMPPLPQTGQEATPRRLLPSKSLTDLGSAMKGIILTETGAVISTPTKSESDGSGEEEANGDDEGRPGPSRLPSNNVSNNVSEAETTASWEKGPYEFAPSVDASHVTARHRPVRRRSIAQPSRPPATSSLIPKISASALTVPLPGGTATTIPTNPSIKEGLAAAMTTSLPPAPVWDLADEESLPSPFAKRNTDFSVYATDKGADTKPTSGGSSLSSTSSSKSIKSSRGSLISRAMKASGEAQKALARRQADMKPSL